MGDDRTPIHVRVRQERLRAGLKMAQCAEALGVHHSQWWRWENGQRRIDAEQLRRMAAVLGVSVARLVGEQQRVVDEIRRG